MPYTGKGCQRCRTRRVNEGCHYVCRCICVCRCVSVCVRCVYVPNILRPKYLAKCICSCLCNSSPEHVHVRVCECICCGPEPGRAQLSSASAPSFQNLKREKGRERHTLRQGKLQFAWGTDKQPGVTQSTTDNNMAASRFALSNRFSFFFASSFLLLSAKCIQVFSFSFLYFFCIFSTDNDNNTDR